MKRSAVLLASAMALVGSLLAGCGFGSAAAPSPASSGTAAAVAPSTLPAPTEPVATPSSPAVSPVVSTSPTVASCTQPSVTLDVYNVNINGNDGVTLTGTSCLPIGNTVWAADYDPEAGKFFLDDNDDGDTAPVITESGQFSFTDRPIGDPDDKHKLYKVTLIGGGQDCDSWFAALLDDKDKDKDITFKGWPAYCTQLAQARIYVTVPE